jgi:hypothetical protein
MGGRSDSRSHAAGVADDDARCDRRRICSGRERRRGGARERVL